MLLLAFPAAAQQDDAGLQMDLRRDFGYGGFDARIQGRFTMLVTGPADLQRVVYYIDDQQIGEGAQAPFNLQFATGDYPDGEHRLYALGYTADGQELRSNEYQRVFIPGDQVKTEMLRIVLPLGGIILGLTLLAAMGSLLLGRGGEAPQIGQYGAAGGAVCPKCGLPFSRHLLAMNLGVGKLERCPHCGKWSLVGRASPATLAQAEARWRADQQGGELDLEEDENERLKRQLEQSRYED